ncbi:MAG TPA: ATP-binding protein [Candidatus Didemnitutus sp.]|nr:ATP-binding protein [Candidatus Didemnitutus sp.]
MKATSIRGRLTGAILVIFFVLVAGGVAAIYAAFRHALVQQFDRTLLTKAQAISTGVSRENGRVRVDFSDRFMRGFDTEVGTDFFELWQEDGSVIQRSETMENADLPQLAGQARVPKFWPIRLPNGRDGVAVGLAFAPKRSPSEMDADESGGRESDPILHLVVATDRSELDQLLAQLAGISIAAVILLTLAALLIPPILRFLFRPLDRLAEQTRTVDAASLATRLPEENLPDELRPIAQRLNELFGRLESAFERERRVSADLAHELRTPIAELRTWSEGALKWPASRDPGIDRETLAIAEHMEAIVTQMLALARSERGTIPLVCEKIDLAELLERAWKPFQPQAETKGLSVRLELRPASCESDPVLLRSILNNLFDNAVSYTPPGGEIAIRCGARAGGVVVRVSNSTVNFGPEDAARLFERFWRKEEARSGGQHVGLGLAIAQSFSKALGWEMSAALESDGRLAFVLTSQVPKPEA